MAHDTVAPKGAKDSLESTLRAQHESITSMLAAVRVADSSERAASFLTLLSFLAAHEQAEETSMHARFKAAGAGEDIVEEREREEQNAGHVIAELEAMDVAGSEFETSFAGLAESVIAHAKAEENEELTEFLRRISDDEAKQIEAQLTRVEAVAAAVRRRSSTGSAAFADMLAAAKESFGAKVENR